MFKKVFFIISLISIAIISWYWNWIQYGISQGLGQFEVINKAVPISELLKNDNSPDSLKAKLLLTLDIRQFAIDSLQLKDTENYLSLYDQKGKTILWNVSACLPYKLEPYEWKYPFLGKMPYKGFFDLNKAKKEAEKLSKDGYDVRIRSVGGWSTLGILPDPLLSNMLLKPTGDLAELIIHEQTHATIFLRENIEFNENLASFVGEKGAEFFLKTQFGDTSTELRNYLQSQIDSRKFTHIMLDGITILDSLYAVLEWDSDIQLKDSLKKLAIQKIISTVQEETFYNFKYYQLFDDQLPNNAYFMAYRRYHSQEDSINQIFEKCHKSIPKLLSEIQLNTN